MPYIKPDRRREIYCGSEPESSGELNYAITMLLNEYLRHRIFNYTSLNEAIGVLECAKLELYRRLAAPYEDRKIEENGDVYLSGG